jgi:archaellum biogenesis ATPase FlaH
MINNLIYTFIDQFYDSKDNQSKIIHISGSNQTGKSLFIKDFLKNVLSNNKINNVYYFDIENKFGCNNYLEEFTPEELYRIKVRQIRSCIEFEKVLKLIKKQILNLSSDDLIVVDSISELLKKDVVHSEGFLEYKCIQNEFYAKILYQIKTLSANRKLRFLITHQISYNLKENCDLPYAYELMKELHGLWIKLKREETFLENDTKSYAYYMDIYLYSENEAHDSKPEKKVNKIEIKNYKLQYNIQKDHLIIFPLEATKAGGN